MKPGSSAFILLLGALSALPPIAIDMGLPAIPSIEAAFADAAGRGPLTLSVFLFGFAVTPLFAGPLADRFGRRPVMLSGLLVFAFAAGACAFTTDFSALLGFRLLQGIAGGACAVVPFAIVRDTMDGVEARTMFAKIMTVIGVAPLVAPLIGSAMLGIVSWEMVYLSQGMVAFILALTVAFCLPETMDKDRRPSLSSATLASRYVEVIANRTFRNFTLVYAFSFACKFAYISASAAVFIQTFGLSASSFALTFGLMSCGLIVGSSLSARLSSKISPMMLISCALCAMNFAVLLSLLLALLDLATLWTLVPLVTIVTISFGIIAPNAVHCAMQPMSGVAATASGLSRSVQMVLGAAASAFGAMATSTLTPVISMSAVMTVCAAAAGGILLWHRLHLPAASEPG
ncbi:hypothetical protein ACO34A_24115 (plasmid) [Rhizobium sp. ACO-34A]|nr:multidrug effflux MFS transporter [Rhizobium sp. ACO-34A]ATN36865.1 hypothetical protein ACO34A_24115 [Rhizobium sp. ACO-34A]